MSDIKQTVQSQFGQVAAHYSASAVHAGGIDLETMVQVAGLQGGERVLDAGAGTCHTALAFAPHVARVAALDFTAEMLQQGRRLAAERGLENLSFHLGDVEQIPFEDASFDLVISRYSGHHWPHPQRALHEFARVLRPGGVLLLDDVVAPDDLTLDTFLNAIELLRDRSHVRDHTAGQWLAMMAGAGFQAKHLHTWDIAINFDSWVRRMATPPVAVAMIKTLFEGAPQAVQQVMKLDGEYNFVLRVALLRGELPAR